jgi:HEAT repeat protein
MGFFSILSSTPPDVAGLSKNGDTKGLVGALKFKRDPAIRRSAAVALGEIHSFQTCLHMVDFTIRITGLQNIEPQNRRQFIADNLSKLNKKNLGKALKSLASALGDADSGVRESAARAIGLIWCGARRAKSYLYSYERWFPPGQFLGIAQMIASPRTSESALDALVLCLQDSEEKVRKAAVEALQATEDMSTAMPALVAVGEKDQSEEVRDSAKRIAKAIVDINEIRDKANASC